MCEAAIRLALSALLMGAALAVGACDSDSRPGSGARATPRTAASDVATARLSSPSPPSDSAGLARATPNEDAGPLGVSPDARWDTYRALAEDLQTPRDRSDGGGRAWLVEPAVASGRPQVEASAAVRFAIVYEAGPLGVAEGGAIFLEPSPFWGWSGPQIRSPEAPGYTTVRTAAQGVELRPEELGPQILGIHVEGRALREGERIEITYGAGPARSRVDRFAEREARIWIAVDGDGDGVRAVLADSPAVDVLPASPARLLLIGPSTASVGERVRFHLSAVDAAGNAGAPAERAIALAAPDGLDVPSLVALRARDRGSTVVEATVRAAGVYRIRATTGDGLSAESNPLVARDGAPPILWADLHGHSQLSDGTGTPEDYFRYARDVAALDAIALTDHDHWGMRFLDRSPELWTRIRRAVESFYEPGRFVTVLGYEWTNWLQGHRHVLYFGGEGEVLSSLDRRYRTPDELWKALAGKPVLTIAHHSAGGPVATNWAYAPDPTLEPVTEVASVHGSSEAWDTPGRIYRPVRGNFARDALARGYRLGFIGSGDSHDGHPGLAQLAGPHGGLAALIGAERTRESVLATLRARRVYATNGPRIWLRVHLGGAPMGAVIDGAQPGDPAEELEVRVAGTAAIERIDLIRGRAGGPAEVDSTRIDGATEWSGARDIPSLAPGEFVYVRVVQSDGGAAWSSPIFARAGTEPAPSEAAPQAQNSSTAN